MACTTALTSASGGQCVQSGATITCTGAFGTATFNTSVGADTLNVGGVLANVTAVSLVGAGAAPGAGGDSHYTCSTGNPNDCVIVLGVNEPDTCTVSSSAPAGTTCVETAPASSGPTGNAGPTITIDAITGAFSVTPGAAGGAIRGSSQGSSGGNGGNAYVFGNAGNGANGADGGRVIVSLAGNVATTANGRPGLVAESLGGNGGDGGTAYVLVGGNGSGGAGGFGGDAGATFVSGSIVTSGASSAGVAAFSRGGNGGASGGGGALLVSPGTAGGAGQAGAAQVSTGAGTSITTSGRSSYGIVARSIGGGGGVGSGAGGIFYSAGSNGSTGGAGGLVTVSAHGTILTQGRAAHGILAQSIGGGGGDAGDVSGAWALGGEGGGGGEGGTVFVLNTGAITTQGFASNAIEAQSIGGGGGHGASVDGLIKAIGGNGAGATHAGAVTVSNSGVLVTELGEAAGIFAQSIGNGGGIGGITDSSFYSVGGSGGAGGNGGAVTVFNGGDISTGIRIPELYAPFPWLAVHPEEFPLGLYLADSPGIVAQSIGGGGGAGAGVTAVNSNFSAAYGGTGGAGGSADTVQIRRDHTDPLLATAYTVHTYGQRSPAVFAQSIGGGGGVGGFNITAATPQLFGAAFGVAGGGGAGGNGGAVLVETKGQLITGGADSPGILAQSIGNGGGAGGYYIAAAVGSVGAAVAIGGAGGSGGSASTVTVSSLSDITTAGFFSAGIVAESLGGGGGRGGFAIAAGVGLAGVSVGLGGTGGGGGSSGAVDVTSVGNIFTTGHNAGAIAGRSIGGGGGSGGFTVSVAGGAGSVAVGVGGSGGMGGSADDVTIGSTGLISTSGVSSPGIFGESIGGGGGSGGFAVSVSLAAALAVSVGVGGSGGIGSSAGDVTIVSLGRGAMAEPGYAGSWTLITRGNSSPGISGQSTGGGGGNAGFSISVAGSATIYGVGGSVGVSVGGSGGAASDGAAVDITSTGAILTLGNFSHGITAQSTGGGGGNGGFSIGAGVTMGQVGVGVSVGGSGDGGGAGKTVTVRSYGVAAPGGSFALEAPAIGTVTIQTDGFESSGILAQSTGGGGGNGGFSIGLGGAVAGAGAGVSIGGTGGGGGDGDVVDVTSYNNIVTAGMQSPGILAQSIGGGGGNGGFSIGLGVGAQFGAGGVSVGGSGDRGGSGKNVTLRSYGTVATSGDDSPGLQAQSISRGGGNGAFSVGGALTGGSLGLGVSVGGSGAGSGGGGTVVVEAYAIAASGLPNLTPPVGVVTIETLGAGSDGISAQSQGGGGGSGAFSAAGTFSTAGVPINLSFGGTGGGGGAGGAVTVTSAHNIVTWGDESNGIFALSSGGGGGKGRMGLGLAGGSEFAGNVAVGGAGGTASDASAVTVSHTGTILTHGVRSAGIRAASSGGGGGQGGIALSGTFALRNGAIGVSVGGFGGAGGTGGTVTVNSNVGTTPVNYWTIDTSGRAAPGIFAQSHGGGGGDGGLSVSATVSVHTTGAASLSMGGFGGIGNLARAVNATSVDNIRTSGHLADGIFAQSLGGGGGSGGISISGLVTVPDGNDFSLSASLGGFGGSGGDAGDVTVHSTGHIATSGNSASGIFAQSQGGGGGKGGLSVAAQIGACKTCASSVPSLAAAVGGSGGAGGKAGNVTLTHVGSVSATGDYFAAGLRAQSIGGGGGDGGLSVTGSLSGADTKQATVSVGGFGGAGSSAGNVIVRNTGSITTGSLTIEDVPIAEPGPESVMMPVRVGFEASGIIAQSVGGGGGNGGLAVAGAIGLTGTNTTLNIGVTVGGFGGSGGTAGLAQVTNDGLITTYGNAAHGIFAQSIGGGGGNGGGAVSGLLGFGNPASTTKSVNVAVAVGGLGGSGNLAGNVIVDQSGGVVTSGSGAHGILAQSVGGGGGAGGNANSISLMLGTLCTFQVPFNLIDLSSFKATKSCKPKPAGSSGASVQVDVGGWGGSGNDAGTVDVTNRDYITTSGRFSAGIVAQSIGGGGGTGGNGLVGHDGLFPKPVALTADVALLFIGKGFGTDPSFVGSAGVVTIGGRGGAAGDGKAVTVENSGAITTTGTHSAGAPSEGDWAYGIFAQSVGGGGGDGGKGASGATGAASIGGFGQAAGVGGSVQVFNLAGGNIFTTGTLSSAIFAQSVGGGGGDGGAAGGLLALGGSGRAAGNGGAVVVQNAAVLDTQGLASGGIFAQSLGGGGGHGGGGGLAGISIGGSGGAGGDGSTVTVDNFAAGSISTLAEGAHGLLAVSTGGGGGVGGSNTLAAAVVIGGSGGAAGIGGTVTVRNNGSIETRGADAIGLFGQSVGGGGGIGGSSFLSLVSVGGASGASGAGGLVDLTNTGAIRTHGVRGDAIRAQSNGGGGGSVTGAPDFLGAVKEAAKGSVVSVGGSGGAGGAGGTVRVSNAGLLHTMGEGASGIYAQSAGGGGGDAGRVAGAVAVGGQGGASGSGGELQVSNNARGIIWTQGDYSNGIFAQSIGGGGGNGGSAASWSPGVASVSVGGQGSGGGNGGHVSVDNFGLIQTDGFGSQAIFAQSVGNGGGVGATAGSTFLTFLGAAVSVGGRGGVGGNGGAVDVWNRSGGSIVINGADSTAIFAQSVGGGGGTGGLASSLALGLQVQSVPVDVGGSGGAGGSGGNVTVTNDGTIRVRGDNSVAILAQSVGGGGGTAAGRDGFGLLSFGGRNGATGDGGLVSVINTGTIFLSGANAIGIFAQSVGGGGGLIQPGRGASSVTANNGGVGDGEKVTVDNTAGNIVVSGRGSIGLFAQSVGGGGGAVTGASATFLFSGSTGGAGVAKATTVNQTGNLLAMGEDSIGLAVQSDARDGRGDITINIRNGSGGQSMIVGGTGLGAGVAMIDGARNQLNNAGLVTTMIGVNGMAIRATGGDDRVENAGVVTGSVDLGAGANAFFNAGSATFNSGSFVVLGAGGLLTNAGTLSPGAAFGAATTSLAGSFVQTANGRFDVDLDLEFGTTDRLNVTGSASMDGIAAIRLVNPVPAAAAARPGVYESTVLSAAGGVSGLPATFEAPHTAVAAYSLAARGSTDLVLRHVIDFAPAGLSANAAAVGRAFNAIQTAQATPGFAPVAVAAFFQPDLSALEETYSALSGSATAGLEGLSLAAADSFLWAVGRQTGLWLGNRVGDLANDDGSRAAVVPAFAAGEASRRRQLAGPNPPRGTPRWRTWITRDGGRTTLPGAEAVGSVESRQRGRGLSGGADVLVRRDLRVGVAGGSGRYSFDAPLRETSGSARTHHVGAYAAFARASFYVAGTAAVTRVENESLRNAVIPIATIPNGGQVGGGEHLTAKFRSWGTSGSVEAGYNHVFGWLTVTPFAALQRTSLRARTYAETVETGESLLGLSYADRRVTSMPAFVGLQLRTEGRMSRLVEISTFARGAWKREHSASRSIESAFIAAPDVRFFVRGAEPARDAARAAVGAQLTIGRFAVFAEADGEFARSDSAYFGSAGLRVRW